MLSEEFKKNNGAGHEEHKTERWSFDILDHTRPVEHERRHWGDAPTGPRGSSSRPHAELADMNAD